MKFELLLGIVLNYGSILYLGCNATKCCIANNDYGIIIIETDRGKDSPLTDQKTSELSAFSLNTLNTNWTNLTSVKNKSKLNIPVYDQRWESFPNSHNDDKQLQDLIKSSNGSLFFSVRIFNESSDSYLKKNQWNHILMKNKTLYSCNCNLTSCSNEFNIENNLSTIYNNTMRNKAFWKLHDYAYLYTETKTTDEKMYTNCNRTKNISSGCFHIYLAACNTCTLTVKLTPNMTSNFKSFTEIKNGDGTWATLKINVTNFTTCFTMIVTTNTTEQSNNSNTFWALSDKFYMSTSNHCDLKTRHLIVNESESKNPICENSCNEKINLTSECNKYASYNFLYLLFSVPPVLVIILISFIYWAVRKKRNQRDLTSTQVNVSTVSTDEDLELLGNPKDPSEENITDWPAIKSNEFISYIGTVFGSKKNHLERQFSSIPSGFLKAAEEGQKPENAKKNKFPKIYPYDENRVKLETDENNPTYSSDYINASYVQGYNNPKEYIITQNPLPNTVTDFFRMIWQEKVEYIVMISDSSDKYHPYWPKEEDTLIYGDTEVYLIQVIPYLYYCHRILEIKKFGQSRKLNQLHFHSWSPKRLSSNDFVDFINHVLQIPHTSSPVMFHCMVGIGRSATILLCDMVLRTSAITGTINFFETTKLLRENRVDMVHKLQQYQLAHLIVYESFKSS